MKFILSNRFNLVIEDLYSTIIISNKSGADEAPVDFFFWRLLIVKNFVSERTTDHGQATGQLYQSSAPFFCNLQSRARTHTVLVIGLFELLGNPTTKHIAEILLKVALNTKNHHHRHGSVQQHISFFQSNFNGVFFSSKFLMKFILSNRFNLVIEDLYSTIIISNKSCADEAPVDLASFNSKEFCFILTILTVLLFWCIVKIIYYFNYKYAICYISSAICLTYQRLPSDCMVFN
jgi:hypothetical protein